MVRCIIVKNGLFFGLPPFQPRRRRMATTLQPRPLVTAISAALIALGLGAVPVYAQTDSSAQSETAENESAEAVAEDTISDRGVLTGSRIARDPNLISPAPV